MSYLRQTTPYYFDNDNSVLKEINFSQIEQWYCKYKTVLHYVFESPLNIHNRDMCMVYMKNISYKGNLDLLKLGP